jgi:L-ascorbate metabolism protein UlaG (beta-lactamase superfamily)
MKIKWLGWASWLIKTEDKIIAIDPFAGEMEEKVDLVLASHDHPDHCDIEKLAKIRKDSTLVLTPSVYASGINAESLDVGQEKVFGNIVVKAVAAYNLNIPNHPKGVNTGYVIEVEGKRIYFASDTDLIEEMKELGEIDLALLPVGGTYTVDLDEAVKAVEIIKPKQVIPMHYGEIDVVFGGHPKHVKLDADPQEFKRKVEEKTSTKVIVLNPGEEVEI